ncbi:uncharacterized protein HMPREF1541_07061 [Cyphellophora europaea CBS 101466]|uniref:MutL C-terminal dimerisation domain-containing protein n=1 Tax=Cyphellophora europaea (strain CBS 101466) TaxID=1220924 RepID=W2RTI6_CYPE1|nr:uncharacterized protein HMPREF1541_07061 [Cyphellophora europaea CBS 101466]ETN39019.1 hypothetical protein HMPREF1541_07061 [Cyphellophora europaea CBS 101466]
MAGSLAIAPLPDSVRAQIKSSVEITSLASAVEELLRNALDADADVIEVVVNFKRGFCSVTDNGKGIPAAEFGSGRQLARPYCTSKSGRSDTYGKNGQALASLSALSIVHIVSRERGSLAHNILLHPSRTTSNSIDLTDTAQEMSSHGTKVIIHNLFGNLPVRFKAQAARSSNHAETVKQFQELKRRLVGYLLASPKPFTLKLSVQGTDLMYKHKTTPTGSAQGSFSATKMQSIFKQAALVDATQQGTWRLASAKTCGISIRAAVSTVARPSKHSQFISVGKQPIPCTGIGALFYDRVNRVFEESQFGAVYETDGVRQGHSGRTISPNPTQASRRGKLVKGVDRWPSFYIRIDTGSRDLVPNVLSLNECEDASSNNIQYILGLLTVLLSQLLQSLHLKPRDRSQAKRTDIRRRHSAARKLSRTSSFDTWTRTRSAFPTEVEDLCEGLPFHNDHELAHSHAPLDADVQLLLDDMELDSEPSTPNPTTSGQDDVVACAIDTTEQDAVSWTNPKTGRSVLLNGNGFVVPAATPRPQGQDSTIAKVQRCGHTDSRRCTVNQRSSTKEIAERLRNWPVKTFASDAEVVVPSLSAMFRTDHAKSVVQQPTIEQLLSASNLACAKVLGQVDEKFILALVPSTESEPNLVLIDQHAADERVKVEQLYTGLCSDGIVALRKPLILETTGDEARLFDEAQAYFDSWGLRYQQSEASKNIIRVSHLPEVIAQRCQQEPKILIGLLRKELWTEHRHVPLAEQPSEPGWISRIAQCPAGIVEMINSRACRSAVMFNDVLTVDQCQELVRRLASCTLPFQCAHGRPSLAVISNLGFTGIGKWEDTSDDFGEAWKRWT